MSNEPTHSLTPMNDGKALIGGIAELLIPKFFPQKKLLMRGQKLFWAKNYGEVVLNYRTNDEIMPRFGRSFINDKCIFQ